MTRFVKKEFDAAEAFQLEMNQFGLRVNTRAFSGTYSTDEKYFNLEVGTEPQPVKGQKALIEKIKAAGYTVWKWRKDYKGSFVFRVVKVFPILREENDCEEYTEVTA